MGPRRNSRIIWHIGPDDLGTEFLADALWARSEELAAAGIGLPGSASLWQRAARELTGTHADQGWDRAAVAGATERLSREIWRQKKTQGTLGTAVLSTPGLAAATAANAALALDGLRGVEVHLVLVTRNLTAQVYAAAQVMLERGGSTKPVTFTERVLADRDSRREGAEATAIGGAFRAGHDPLDILARWAGRLPAANLHVIAQDDPATIWAELLALAGAPERIRQDFPGAKPVQTSLGGLDLLRSTLLDLGPGTIPPGVVRSRIRGLLALSDPDLPPVDGYALVRDWTAALDQRGITVTGELQTAGSEGTDQLTADQAFANAVEEIARLQALVESLREDNDRLDRKRRKHKRRLKELAAA